MSKLLSIIIRYFFLPTIPNQIYFVNEFFINKLVLTKKEKENIYIFPV